MLRHIILVKSAMTRPAELPAANGSATLHNFAKVATATERAPPPPVKTKG